MNRTVERQGTVFVVDDDPSIRRAMQYLMKSAGLLAEAFESAEAFLERFDPDLAGCALLDLRMPGIGGLELQERLRTLGSTLPVIFVSGHGDVPMAVEAMRNGAFDFILKPFRHDELLDRVRNALDVNRLARTEQDRQQEIVHRCEKLTKREREVMELVVTGKPNKLIAYELGTSQRTVEIHRSRVMSKMGAASLAELVRMSLLLQSVSDS